MTAQTRQARFLYNNFAAEASLTATTAYAGFPATNVQDDNRSKVWLSTGLFAITATNNQVLINDGSDKAASVTVSDYATPVAFAAAVQTALNAVSSNWTCTYSSTTCKFTIGRSSGTKILRKSVTTNAAWDTLGYTGSVDEAATAADEARIHTHEALVFDLGAAQTLTAAAAIGPLSSGIGLSSSAVVKLQANNSLSWTAPAFDRTLDPTAAGILEFLDDETVTYRYVRLYIQDRTNATAGPSGLTVGHVYLGQYQTLNSTVGVGFEFVDVDPSIESLSEGGAKWFDVRAKFRQVTGLSYGLLTEEERTALRTVYSRVGRSTPFYISLDPQLLVSSDPFDLGGYFYFTSDPRFRHVLRDIFSMSFDLEEAR